MLMTNKTWLAGVLSLALSTAAPVWAEDVTAETVVATVGGQDITVGHMIVARNTLPPQYQQLESGVLFEGILDQLIQQTALAQSLGDDVTTATKLSIDNQTSGLLAGEAIGKAIQVAITDDALQAAYEARFADAEPQKEFNAAHILVETEEEATALKVDLDGGADFVELAREKSTGPSGPNGGDLGWFGVGMMVPEFEAAVVSLEPGQISDPVKTQFGWHVITLNDTRLADAPTLDDVREELMAELEGAAVDAAVQEVMGRTEVTKPDADIDPAILGNLDLIAN